MALATPTRRMALPEQVRDFFADLLGKAVAVDKAAEPDLADDERAVVCGIFVTDDGQVGGACIADLSLAANAGAALAMIPKPVADESIARAALDDTLRENFYEVANILTSLLNGPSVAHLKIGDLVDGVPDVVRDLAIRSAGRRHFNVTITDYGSGTLSLYAR